MTPEEFEEVMLAIHRSTMNAILPGGVWTIALLGLSQIVGSLGLIFLWTR